MLGRQSRLLSRLCRALTSDGNLLASNVQLRDVSYVTIQLPPSVNPGADVEKINFQCIHRHGFAKAAKDKGKKGGKETSATGKSAANTITEFDISSYKTQMQRAIDHLQHELANIRTGRATPGMLDHLKVEIYGEKMPLKAVGTVSVRDSQLLAVTVFDPSSVEAVSTAITTSPLQLNPRIEGQEILVPIPRPTAETMAAMGKVCKAEGETAKVSVRHVRKVAMEAAASLASEDEQRRAEKEVQMLTDKVVADIEAFVASKQKDIAAHNS